MNIWIAFISAITYLAILFVIAWISERQAKRGRSLLNNPYTYALSLAVYCTAWTFYGSVGLATTSGILFLPIYLGPTLAAPLLYFVLKKIIRISKHQRITSIADFISARYGRSTSVGVWVALVAVFGIVPYISIQLKAITSSFEILVGDQLPQVAQGHFYGDTGFYVTVMLAAFAILFGTRRLDASERHEGLVAAVAFESIIKLIAFLVIGVFVTFFMFDGFSDLFAQAAQHPRAQNLFDFSGELITSNNWLWVMVISMFSILCLPRQFHMAVVENINVHHVNRAIWLFPLYLLLINVFVIPIALGGIIHLPAENFDGDTYVLNLPLSKEQPLLALIAFIGGVSAATSMLVVATVALSIMISNNIITPLLIQTSVIRDEEVTNVSKRLLNIRRSSIVFILIMAYGYLEITGRYTIVSVGLISFTAVAQFAPMLLVGLYWKDATKHGARMGLVAGFLVWFYTLVLPTFADSGLLPAHTFDEGLLGMAWLKPSALFGIQHMDAISQAAFWSLFFNTSFFIGGSLLTRPSMEERTQADVFVNIHKYTSRTVVEQDVIRRKASIKDLTFLLNRFVGRQRTEAILTKYAQQNHLDLKKLKEVDADFINYIENMLTGAIGAASTKTLIGSIVTEDAISTEELIKLLDETQEIVRYSKALEKKSNELQQTTQELQRANDRLKELDKLKDDFISTITHELRTPITSIKAFAKILEEEQLEPEQADQFLSIIVSESERVARLVNQVLDLKKIQSGQVEYKMQATDLRAILLKAIKSITPTAESQGVILATELPEQSIEILADEDKIMQVVVNLLSNALKFCDRARGKVTIRLIANETYAQFEVEDNGIGIAKEKQALIFDRFTQLGHQQYGKPTGSGLGLYITQAIIQQHNGKVGVESELGKGARFWVRLPV